MRGITEIERNKKLEKEIRTLTEKNISFQIKDIIKNSKRTIKDKNYLVYRFRNLEADILRKVSDLVLDKLPKKSVIFLASDKGLFVCRLSKDLKERVSACDILSQILESFGGSGGGRIDFAQGGLKDLKQITQVMKKAEEIIKKTLSK